MKLIAIALVAYFIIPATYKPQSNNELRPEVFSKAYEMIKEGQLMIEEGDLIVRMNQDPLSQFIKNFNRHDKRYSHSGIVLFENGYPYVYHMVSGDENKNGRLKKDCLLHFCDPVKNFGYGIYRYNINTIEKKQLKGKIYQWQSEGVRFDSSFNLQTDAAMYCSEMVEKAIGFATGNRIKIKTTTITKREASILAKYLQLPLKDIEKLQVVAIDNLYTNPDCSAVRHYNFFK